MKFLITKTALTNSKNQFYYDISLDPFRSFFLVPDYAWKTKIKNKEKTTETHSNTKLHPILKMVGTTALMVHGVENVKTLVVQL